MEKQANLFDSFKFAESFIIELIFFISFYFYLEMWNHFIRSNDWQRWFAKIWILLKKWWKRFLPIHINKWNEKSLFICVNIQLIVHVLFDEQILNRNFPFTNKCGNSMNLSRFNRILNFFNKGIINLSTNCKLSNKFSKISKTFAIETCFEVHLDALFKLFQAVFTV